MNIAIKVLSKIILGLALISFFICNITALWSRLGRSWGNSFTHLALILLFYCFFLDPKDITSPVKRLGP